MPSHPVEPFTTFVTSDAGTPAYAAALYAGALPTYATVRSELQPLNTFAPSVATPSGTITSFKDAHPSNIRPERTLNPFGSETLERFTHPENTSSPRLVTPDGIPASVSDVHPANALAPIPVTLAGSSTTASASHPSNSESTIW